MLLRGQDCSQTKATAIDRRPASLPAGCLGVSTDSFARLFFQRQHCTISKLAMNLSSQIHQRKDVFMVIPNILRDSKPILLVWVLRCRDKLLAFSLDPRNGMLITGLSSSSWSGKTLSWKLTVFFFALESIWGHFCLFSNRLYPLLFLYSVLHMTLANGVQCIYWIPLLLSVTTKICFAQLVSLYYLQRSCWYT